MDRHVACVIEQALYGHGDEHGEVTRVSVGPYENKLIPTVDAAIALRRDIHAYFVGLMTT